MESGLVGRIINIQKDTFYNSFEDAFHTIDCETVWICNPIEGPEISSIDCKQLQNGIINS